MKSEQFKLHAQMDDAHWWFRGRRKIAWELISRAAPDSEFKTMVDIGCGTGGNLMAFSDRYQCIGIDPSEEAVAMARKKLPKAQFLSGDIWKALDQVALQAELFLLMDVLEHLPDDERFLSSLVQKMRSGNLLFITAPANMSLWSPHDESFGHYRRYTQAGLEALWAGLPVEPLLVSYYNARLYPIVRVLRWLSHKTGKAQGEAGTDFRLPPKPVNALLESIFAGEAGVLIKQMEGKTLRGYSNGVSLVALLRRS